MNMENLIEIKIGDVVRFNNGRTLKKVLGTFEYDGDTHYVIDNIENKYNYSIMPSNQICGVHPFGGNLWDGVVEVNGFKVRGKGGELLETPVEVDWSKMKGKHSPKPVAEVVELTDFQKFVKLQNSGRINMTDIAKGCAITGLSEEKYTDIMFNYQEYKEGKRK